MWSPLQFGISRDFKQPLFKWEHFTHNRNKEPNDQNADMKNLSWFGGIKGLNSNRDIEERRNIGRLF